MRPVDYSLIYRLEDERLAREKAYVCPMQDWVKDFRDKIYPIESVWLSPPAPQTTRGMVWGGPMRPDPKGKDPRPTRWRPSFCHLLDECSGEIPWR